MESNGCPIKVPQTPAAYPAKILFCNVVYETANDDEGDEEEEEEEEEAVAVADEVQEDDGCDGDTIAAANGCGGVVLKENGFDDAVEAGTLCDEKTLLVLDDDIIIG
jgi:hypothetical protein